MDTEYQPNDRGEYGPLGTAIENGEIRKLDALLRKYNLKGGHRDEYWKGDSWKIEVSYYNEDDGVYLEATAKDGSVRGTVVCSQDINNIDEDLSYGLETFISAEENFNSGTSNFIDVLAVVMEKTLLLVQKEYDEVISIIDGRVSKIVEDYERAKKKHFSYR